MMTQEWVYYDLSKYREELVSEKVAFEMSFGKLAKDIPEVKAVLDEKAAELERVERKLRAMGFA